MDRYHRLRRRAVVWTIVVTPVLAIYALQFVLYLRDHDPRGAWITFQGGLVAIGAGFLLRYLWSRALRAKPNGTDDAGVPDASSDGHPSIRGQQSIPTRW